MIDSRFIRQKKKIHATPPKAALDDLCVEMIQEGCTTDYMWGKVR